MPLGFDPALIETRCMVCDALRFLDQLLEVRSLTGRDARPRFVCRPRPDDASCFRAIGPASTTAIAAAIPESHYKSERAHLELAAGLR
jgi:hypothetical protein